MIYQARPAKLVTKSLKLTQLPVTARPRMIPKTISKTVNRKAVAKLRSIVIDSEILSGEFIL